MEEAPKSEGRYRWGTIIAGSILVILYVALCVTAITFGFSNKPQEKQEETSITPIVSPTPHILVYAPNNKNLIKTEDFDPKFFRWKLYYSNGKIEVINEKLIFQSTKPNGIAIADKENFISKNDTYYVQADFITDVEIRNQSFGLVFGLNRSAENFYLFEVTPQAEVFRLFRNTGGNWDLLIDYTEAEMNQYPQENTLSVYFNKGTIEFFINGNQVGAYIDEKPLQFSGVGVYVNNYGYRLIVDNFFGYSE